MTASTTNMQTIHLGQFEGAAVLVSQGRYPEAEVIYRHLITTLQTEAGVESTYREVYNLSAVLIAQHKFEEAEGLLREVLTFLEKRVSKERKKREWVEQEVGCMRLIGKALEGMGRTEEARRIMVEAENICRNR